MNKPTDDTATDVLIREVDEDLRQEQMAALWKRYGNWVIGAAVALVAVVAGREAWIAWKDQQAARDGSRFAAATLLAETGKAAEAGLAYAAMAKDATGGYAALAHLRQAALLAKDGKNAEAAAAFDALAADGSADKAYRAAATLQAALLTLDSADPSALERRVAPLAAADSPWRHSAQEVLALLALRQGDRAKARDAYAKLSDDAQAPRGLRARAAEALAALGPASKG
ncbi:MAG: tetratricopeptide repeat protein [Rhodospirillales bacterium]|nr:tetratricopeptide repeat protein [Rhodospirillales bacterium]